MSPELYDYKTQTINQLLTSLPKLESLLAQETDTATVRHLSKQIGAIHAHIERLRQELSNNVVAQPVASELYRKATQATVKEKFYLAQKRLNELETIEPFYPGIARLKQEITTGKISRNTRSIAEGTVPAFQLSAHSAFPATSPTGNVVESPVQVSDQLIQEEQGTSWSNLFQFHILVSCSLIFFLFCMMAGVGGTTLLEFLIEGS
jgi:uncharacterized small protein (DUF1192 family)